MIHRAKTVTMPRISHVSKESMISATETIADEQEGDSPEDSPGGERDPYEQGHP